MNIPTQNPIEDTQLTSILETPRLYLRQLTPSDVQRLFRVLGDQESMRYYPHAFSMDEVARWIERNRERYHTDGFGLWAVIRKEDNAFLGDCGITLQLIDGEILPEIGFHIIKEFCNKGYATEAAAACKQYAMEVLGFRAIYSYSESKNKASQKVAAKIGMTHLKTFNNNGVETVVYAYKAQN